MRCLTYSGLVLFLPFALTACAEAPLQPKAPASTSAAAVSAETTPATPAAVTALRRSQVRVAISRGLGVFFQHIALDDYPVMQAGKFHGFRLRAVDADWRVDLRPGDVVTRVNGMPIEHPEDADAAMRALDKAKALRIDYERDGKARIFELPIVDDGTP